MIRAADLRGNATFASTYYSVLGLLLVIGSFVTDTYISGLVIPFLVFIFSAFMSAIIIKVKAKQEKVT